MYDIPELKHHSWLLSLDECFQHFWSTNREIMIYTLDNKIIVSFYYTCESKGEKHAALVYILTYMTWIVVMEMCTMTTSTADRENKQTEITVRERWMSDQLAHFSHHHTLPVSPAWTRSPFSLSLNAQKHSTSPEQVSRLLLLLYYIMTL